MAFFLWDIPPVGDFAEFLAAWFPIVVTVASVARMGGVWLEGLLVIWVHQTPESKFWVFWTRLMQSLDYISISRPRQPHAIRALYKWDQARKRQDELGDVQVVPIKGGNDEEK